MRKIIQLLDTLNTLYDSDENKIELVRVEYDYRITQKKIRDKHLPLFLAERLEKGR